MIFAILGLMAAIVAMILVVRVATREIETKRSEGGQPAQTGLTHGIQRELVKLSVPSSKIRQASESIHQLVNREFQERSKSLREEFARNFQEVVVTKEKALKKAEDDYRQVSDQYQTLGTQKKQTESVVRAVAEGRIVVNDRGETVMVSPEAEKILRASKESVLGKPIAKLKGKETLLSFFGRLADSEEETLHTFSEDEETQRRVRQSSAVIESESGHTRGMISALPEVTRQNEIQEYKNQLMASFSHELRTPLVCIQKSLGAVLEGEFGAVTPGQKEYLGIATRNTSKLERMVTQILDFSRLEAGKIRLHPELFSVTELIQEIKEDFQAWAADKQITLNTEYEGSEFVMIADKERIGQVLMNLLSNALKFTPKGGKVTVKAGLVSPQDMFLPPEHSEYMAFTVEDTGIGIPDQEKKRIFDQFVRLENPAAESVQGTGLGLSIAQAIVQLHGGRIWVGETPEKGSQFVFVVPKNAPI